MNNTLLLKILIHLTVIALVLLLPLGWLGSSAVIDSVYSIEDSAAPQARKYVEKLNRPINDNLQPQLVLTLC